MAVEKKEDLRAVSVIHARERVSRKIPYLKKRLIAILVVGMESLLRIHVVLVMVKVSRVRIQL